MLFKFSFKMGFFDNFAKGGKKSNTTIVKTPKTTINNSILTPPPMSQNNITLPPPPIPKKHVETNIRNENIKTQQPIINSPNPITNSTYQNINYNESSSTNAIQSQIATFHPQNLMQESKMQFKTNNQNLYTRNIPDFLPDLKISKESSILPNFRGGKLPSFSEQEDTMILNEIPFFEEEIDKSMVLENKTFHKGPLFIRTDEYSQILTNIDIMRNYVLESPEIIYMLKNLKKNSDIEHKNYLKLLEDIQRKIIYVDSILFESMK